MKTIELKINFTLFDNLDELSDEDQLLVARAKEATLKAYAPYSHFQVGCAVLLENNEIITAANQENAAYPACICAERVALSAASSRFPGVKPVKLAVAVKNASRPAEKPAAPCGVCRQTLNEYEKRFNQPIEILLRGEVGPIYKLKSVSDLLPLGFSGEDLK